MHDCVIPDIKGIFVLLFNIKHKKTWIGCETNVFENCVTHMLCFRIFFCKIVIVWVISNVNLTEIFESLNSRSYFWPDFHYCQVQLNKSIQNLLMQVRALFVKSKQKRSLVHIYLPIVMLRMMLFVVNL